MSAKYKVGDKVTIKKRTLHQNSYRNGFVDEMAELCGKRFRIQEIFQSASNPTKVDDDGYDYYLDIEDEKIPRYTWVSSMFEDKSSSIGDFTRNKERVKFNFSL